jgi:hypothetical protein
MKKTALALIAFGFIAQISHADIPGRPETSKRASIEGDAALALYKAINSKEIMTGALRTGSYTAKVLRAKDGLSQVVCEVYRNHLDQSEKAHCNTELSTDGKELPAFKPTVRMG